MKQAPNSICILRLSAIGDVTHMIPVVHTLQKYWPDTKLSWVIGKNEANLVQDFANIDFIIFDKSNAIASYRSIRKIMRKQSFDVLLCAQVSLRANFISTLIPAKLKLGYDKARAKDLHSLFIDESIAATPQQHVLDSFFSFIEYLGLNKRELSWNYSIPKKASEFANQYIDKNRFNLLISPCSSHIEQAMQTKATNLIGKDTLKKFLALLEQADAIITPDSGPAHMATGFNTPVLGLYAASNSKRSGPYLSQEWCVDKYDDAAQKFKNKLASDLKWGTKLEYDGVMDLIQVKDVTDKLEQLAKLTNTR